MKRLVLILLVVILLPALFYSGYELSSLSSSEGLLADIYRRQLDAILFSVNQYAYDITNNWVSQANLILTENPHASKDSIQAAFVRYFAGKTSIEAIGVADTALGKMTIISNPEGLIGPGAVLESLKTNRDKIDRLLRYQRLNYRKNEPVVTGHGVNGGVTLALPFITDPVNGEPKVAVVVFDEVVFIADILSKKLQETAGEEFALAVFREGISKPDVVTSTEVNPSEMKQRTALWVFPNTYVGIRLKGKTVEDLVHARFNRNMLLIVLFDLVLAAGAWFVYRSMRKEMELVRLKSDFVSNVSHELRTPLALIRMFAETLEMGRLSDEQKKREYYSTILQETERLTRLVNNILNFSRMEAGRKEYRFVAADLNAVVCGVLDTYETHLKSEGCTPVLDLGEGLPKISADTEAVSEAIINLVDNAVKYSPGEKYLRIRTSRSNAGVIVEFEDHGIGIAPEHQKKIFETFFRVSTGLVHNTKGSGLGLALVKHIMDAHKGSVTVQSESGKGSTFRLNFPA